MLRHRRLFFWLTSLLLISWLSPLRAEEPILVNFDAKVVKAATVKDDQGKKLKLTKNEKVTVRYLRSQWCWLQTKKKKTAWVPCASLRPSQPPAAAEPAPAVATAAPTATSQPVTAPTQPVVAIATPPAAAASSAPKIAASTPAATAAADKLAAVTGKRKVLVLRLDSSADVGADVQAAMESAMAQALDELGPFATVAHQDIAGMLELEAAKQRTGCETASCLAEIGGALGVDYTVSGRLMLTGQVYLLQLTLTDVRQATVVARASRDFRGSPAGLVDEARTAVRQLVRPLLEAASGSLALTVSESDATISVDTSIVGMSPLASITLPSGPHTLRIEKSGFVRWARDVNVTANQSTGVDVKLVPSAEYRDAYHGRNLALRIGALSALGLGGLALASAGGLYAWRAVQANALSQKIDDYNALPDRSKTVQNQLTAQRRTIASYDVATVAVAGGGLLVGLTGAILFFIGDDPGRYDQ